MKKALSLFLGICLTALASGQTDTCCRNIGFESGYFLIPSNPFNWAGERGSYTATPPFVGTPWIAADTSVNTPPNNAARFHMLSINGTDPNCCGNAQMSFIAPGGGTRSVRLGNAMTGYGAERLTYSMVVDSCNAGFSYSYAVVLQDPGHTPTQQPRFDIRVTDASGNILGGNCGTYSVYAGSDPSFQACGQVRYKTWVTVGVDLIPYIGMTVNLSFATMDCGLGGHYGYAYIDAGCSALTANVNFCPNSNNSIILIAPPGYAQYQWYDPLGNPISAPQGTNDTCVYTGTANIGDQFTVAMISVSGCTTNLTVVLNPTLIQAANVSTNATCYGGTGTITTTPQSGFPNWTITYTDLSNNSVVFSSTTNGPPVSDSLGAGTYLVTYTDSLGCRHRDTLTITQPPPPQDTLPQTIGFCNGDSVAWYYYSVNPAYQSGPYQWLNFPSGSPITGATDTLIYVQNPTVGQNYYFTWFDPNGCKRRSVVTSAFAAPNPLFGPDTTSNVFTPNGDGQNDVYYPYMSLRWRKDDIVYYTKEFKIQIFNRWGNLVFETDDYNKGWDGRTKTNAEAGAGVYFWIATYKNRCAPESDPPIQKTGYVHIFK